MRQRVMVRDLPSSGEYLGHLANDVPDETRDEQNFVRGFDAA
jgi:hypothetical protein